MQIKTEVRWLEPGHVIGIHVGTGAFSETLRILLPQNPSALSVASIVAVHVAESIARLSETKDAKLEDVFE